VFDDGLEQRLQVGREVVRVSSGPALLGHRIDHGRLELVGVLRELEKQVVDLAQGSLGVGVLAVHLVDHDDDAQPDLERLAEDEARLRHGSFRGIDQQEAAVGHVQDPLDLASEVRMARRVDDVDGHVAVADGCVLGEDGDALLALEVVGVHDQRADVLVVSEGVALLEKRIDQRRLAVVDVRDDRHVADVVAQIGESHSAADYT